MATPRKKTHTELRYTDTQKVQTRKRRTNFKQQRSYRLTTTATATTSTHQCTHPQTKKKCLTVPKINQPSEWFVSQSCNTLPTKVVERPRLRYLGSVITCPNKPMLQCSFFCTGLNIQQQCDTHTIRIIRLSLFLVVDSLLCVPHVSTGATHHADLPSNPLCPSPASSKRHAMSGPKTSL